MCSPRLWRLRRWLRRRVLSLPRVIRTKAKMWRLEPLTLFGVLTGSLLGVFPAIKGTQFQIGPTALFVPIWLGILVLRTVYSVARAGSQTEAALESLQQYAFRLTEAIQKAQVQVLHRAGGTGNAMTTGEFVEDILRHITETARVILGAPAFIEMHSNLMEPTSVSVLPEKAVREGLRITRYDRVPTNASWTAVAQVDIGAGQTFSTGRVEVVEDTHEPIYGGALAASRARCWASFPVIDASGKRLAVVNIDATHPYVLTTEVCRARLADAIRPFLKLLSEVIR
jgi:GAF domain-containing protein